jgi:DNA ligase (NAD+)
MIVNGLESIKGEFDILGQYSFNLEVTPLRKDIKVLSHALFGKKVVFTGKMAGSRDEMKKYAKSIGIVVATTVSAKTDYLVIGEKVGQKKIESAQKFGVEVMTEQEYLIIVESN